MPISQTTSPNAAHGQISPKRIERKTLSIRKRGSGGWSAIAIQLRAARPARATLEERLRRGLICCSA